MTSNPIIDSIPRGFQLDLSRQENPVHQLIPMRSPEKLQDVPNLIEVLEQRRLEEEKRIGKDAFVQKTLEWCFSSFQERREPVMIYINSGKPEVVFQAPFTWGDVMCLGGVARSFGHYSSMQTDNTMYLRSHGYSMGAFHLIANQDFAELKYGKMKEEFHLEPLKNPKWSCPMHWLNNPSRGVRWLLQLVDLRAQIKERMMHRLAPEGVPFDPSIKTIYWNDAQKSIHRGGNPMVIAQGETLYLIAKTVPVSSMDPSEWTQEDWDRVHAMTPQRVGNIPTLKEIIELIRDDLRTNPIVVREPTQEEIEEAERLIAAGKQGWGDMFSDWGKHISQGTKNLIGSGDRKDLHHEQELIVPEEKIESTGGRIASEEEYLAWKQYRDRIEARTRQIEGWPHKTKVFFETIWGGITACVKPQKESDEIRYRYSEGKQIGENIDEEKITNEMNQREDFIRMEDRSNRFLSHRARL